MKKFTKKFAVLFTVVTLLCSMFPLSASAASGYKQISISGGKASSEYNCSFWQSAGPGGWTVNWGANGSSMTYYSSANRANTIVHRNILSCSGVGSITIGSSGVSGSVSGHSATFTYSASNCYYVNPQYQYKITGMLAAWGYGMRTSSTVTSWGILLFYSSGN